MLTNGLYGAICDYMFNRLIQIPMPQTLGDGRLDGPVLWFHQLRNSEDKTQTKVCLDFSRLTEILPAGFAILACLFDIAIEQEAEIKCLNIPRKFKSCPVIENLKNLKNYKTLPAPNINSFVSSNILLEGLSKGVSVFFTEKLSQHFGLKLSEDSLFCVRLLLNELMINAVDHSLAERAYLYSGIVKDEFHFGVLDMGVSIPARMKQKYTRQDDLSYLRSALEQGTTTRRARPGGIGLATTFDLVKKQKGRLTMLSGEGSLRRYFNTRKTAMGALKVPLYGTWCFVRLPIK